jgi:hypothetical protein
MRKATNVRATLVQLIASNAEPYFMKLLILLAYFTTYILLQGASTKNLT